MQGFALQLCKLMQVMQASGKHVVRVPCLGQACLVPSAALGSRAPESLTRWFEAEPAASKLSTTRQTVNTMSAWMAVPVCMKGLRCIKSGKPSSANQVQGCRTRAVNATKAATSRQGKQSRGRISCRGRAQGQSKVPETPHAGHHTVVCTQCQAVYTFRRASTNRHPHRGNDCQV